MLRAYLIQLGDFKVLDDEVMDTAFTSEDFGHRIDEKTGGEPTDKIILKQLNCSCQTGSGVFDALTQYAQTAKELVLCRFY